jgi:hypothetical protein
MTLRLPLMAATMAITLGAVALGSMAIPARAAV